MCYPNITPFPRLPDEAAAALWDLGFSLIIVPFYGNPHFVREGLCLRPVYQDRWIQAYSLAPPGVGFDSEVLSAAQTPGG